MVKILLPSIAVVMIAGFIIGSRNQQIQPSSTKSQTCVPTFRDGGGPYYQPNTPLRQNIAPEKNNGEKLIITGKVIASDCQTPLSNVAVDIWQANESGNYDDTWYRGRVVTADDGSYIFETVVPKGYGEGTGYRPPHIHFKIWQNGRELITSQMFLPESRQQGIEDAYIINVETMDVNGSPIHYGSHDIVLPEG